MARRLSIALHAEARPLSRLVKSLLGYAPSGKEFGDDLLTTDDREGARLEPCQRCTHLLYLPILRDRRHIYPPSSLHTRVYYSPARTDPYMPPREQMSCQVIHAAASLARNGISQPTLGELCQQFAPQVLAHLAGVYRAEIDGVDPNPQRSRRVVERLGENAASTLSVAMKTSSPGIGPCDWPDAMLIIRPPDPPGQRRANATLSSIAPRTLTA